MEVQKDETQPDDQAWSQVSKDRAVDESQTRASESAAPEQPAKDAGATGAETDPLVGLPEPTRKLIEGLGAKLDAADKRLATFDRQLSTANGTIGNLKQRLDESQVKLKAIEPTVEAVEAQKKAAETLAADELAKKRATAREKLAEVFDADVVDHLMPADATPAAKVDKVVEEKPAPATTEKVAETVDTAEQMKVLTLQRELSDRVPGWMKIRDTDDFKKWLPAQNADIKAKSESWDPDVAASVFQAFEKHKSDAAKVAQVEKDRQERLRRGENIQGRGSSSGSLDTTEDGLWNQVKRDREKSATAG